MGIAFPVFECPALNGPYTQNLWYTDGRQSHLSVCITFLKGAASSCRHPCLKRFASKIWMQDCWCRLRTCSLQRPFQFIVISVSIVSHYKHLRFSPPCLGQAATWNFLLFSNTHSPIPKTSVWNRLFGNLLSRPVWLLPSTQTETAMSPEKLKPNRYISVKWGG